jgi:hypothetical protein
VDGKPDRVFVVREKQQAAEIERSHAEATQQAARIEKLLAEARELQTQLMMERDLRVVQQEELKQLAEELERVRQQAAETASSVEREKALQEASAAQLGIRYLERNPDHAEWRYEVARQPGDLFVLGVTQGPLTVEMADQVWRMVNPDDAIRSIRMVRENGTEQMIIEGVGKQSRRVIVEIRSGVEIPAADEGDDAGPP